MKSACIKLLENEKFNVLVIVTVSCLVMLPIFFRGIPYGYDMAHHFQCAYSYYEGFLAGDPYPSWSAVRNLGYGGMELRLYPPLAHYSLAGIYSLVRDWHIALWLTISFYSIAGSLGIYFWARELMPSKQAVFAGCFYAILPYHLNQIYNTFFFAEYVGAAILPFSFWFVYRVAKRGKAVDVAGLAVSYAALILTHLPLTVIGSICFAVYGLSLLERKKFTSQIAKLSLGILFGLAAGSFFWIKVLQERSLMAKSLVYPDSWFDFRLHFLLTPLQTYADETTVKVYQQATSFYDLMLLCAVSLTAFCAIPFVIWTKGKLEQNLKGIWLIFSLSLLLMLPVSAFLWERLFFLQEVQFPWRWLAILGVAAAVLSASKINLLFAWFQTSKRPLALIITGAIFAIIVFSATKIVNKAPFIPTDITQITIESVQHAKGLPFWWTLWAREEGVRQTEKVSVENREVQIETWQATEREFQVSAGENGFARINAFYHPNWRAAVNDVAVEIQPDLSGAILIPITKQAAVIKLRFRETSAVQAGNWISLLTWFGLFSLLFREVIKKKLPSKDLLS